VLVSGNDDGTVQTWNTSTWQPARKWTTPARLACLAVSPDGAVIAAGQVDGAIHLWDRDAVSIGAPLREHVRRVDALAFLPEGKSLASAGEDHIVRLWHLASRRCLLTLPWHDTPVRSLAASPDGNAILSGDRSGQIGMWQAPSFARIAAGR
jgi:WD40 repeat protein